MNESVLTDSDRIIPEFLTNRSINYVEPVNWVGPSIPFWHFPLKWDKSFCNNDDDLNTNKYNLNEYLRNNGIQTNGRI